MLSLAFAFLSYYITIKGEALESLLAQKQQILAARDGNTEATQAIILAHFPMCQKIAATRTYRRDLFLDYAHEGIFGIMVAIRKYDVDKQYKFITYASWWIFEYISTAQSKEFKYQHTFSDIDLLPTYHLAVEDSGFDQGVSLIAEIIANSCGRLSPLSDRILRRYYEDSWTDKAIAAVIGTSMSYARKARTTALESLKNNTILSRITD